MSANDGAPPIKGGGLVPGNGWDKGLSRPIATRRLPVVRLEQPRRLFGAMGSLRRMGPGMHARPGPSRFSRTMHRVRKHRFLSLASPYPCSRTRFG